MLLCCRVLIQPPCPRPPPPSVINTCVLWHYFLKRHTGSRHFIQGLMVGSVFDISVQLYMVFGSSALFDSKYMSNDSLP